MTSPYNTDENASDGVIDHGAIVLGTNVNGIGVVRSLGQLGVTCAALFAEQYGDHAYHTKYLKHSLRVSPNASDKDLTRALVELSARLNKSRPVLIPTSDRYSQFLCRNVGELSQRYRLNCPEFELCDAFLDKWKTAQICMQNAVPIPDTYCPASDDELAQLAANFSYPIISKPRYTFDKHFPGKNAVFHSFSELSDFLDRFPALGDVVLQQIIPSGDGDIFVIATYSDLNGRVQAIYSGRKIRQYLPDYGATSFGVSERQPALETLTRKFLDTIGYRGFSMVEFARDRDSGEAYFLELNTRTSWTNQLYADSGVDLTQIGYLDMIGLDFRDVLGEVNQTEGIHWLDFRRDFASFRLKNRYGHVSFIEWAKSIIKARSFAYWQLRDPKPFIIGCLWRIREILIKHVLPNPRPKTQDHNSP